MGEQKNQGNPADRDGISVLVLDDEQEIVETVTDILGDEGCQITGCQDPKLELERIRSQTYDIILTDLVMPGYTGIDVANFVMENNLDVLVIVITAHATVETAIQAIQLGVYDYIEKPFNPYELQLLVKRASERLKLQRKNQMLNEGNRQMIQDITMMSEISSILYQVHDINSASTMILDTITEYFKIHRSAIALQSGDDQKFRIVNARNITQSLIDHFSFGLNRKINDQLVSDSEITLIKDVQSELKTDGRKIPVQDFSSMMLIPVSFHNRVTGFVILFFSGEENPLTAQDVKILEIMSIQISPVIHAFACQRHEEIGPEQQVDQLLQNYLYESQSLLRPVSFGLFRLQMKTHSEDLIKLGDLIQSCRNVFNSIFQQDSDIRWLTLDTALVVLPGIDYFQTEARCSDLKEKIENISVHEDGTYTFSLHYACLGYPDSGDDINEISRMLWSKLIDDLISFNEMEDTQ